MSWEEELDRLVNTSIPDDRYLFLPRKEGVVVRCSMCARVINTTPTDRVEHILEDVLDHETNNHKK